MDITSALRQQTNKQVKLNSSHDYMKDAVWECHLYRLGYDSRYYKDIEPCEREDFLNKLESQNGHNE
jgi:hypothetical protein